MGVELKLIWHASGLEEADWIRYVFGDLISSEIDDFDLACLEDNSIHVISSNVKPLPKYEAYFSECRVRCQNLILFHASDEFFSGGYRLYRHFDAVIRNFHTYLADAPGILTIPEGYSIGMSRSEIVRPADIRRFAWSFTGEFKASRIEMRNALEGLHPELMTATDSISAVNRKKLSKDEFASILGDTVFSPCPMGNVILETWRFYESLEMGCIPLLEKRKGLDYFTDLLGPHPVPSFQSWAEARRYAEAEFANKAGLLHTQAVIHSWWQAHKAAVKSQVKTLIEGPSQASELRQYSEFVRNRVPIMHEALRLAQLLRHQTPQSILRRLSRPHGPLKRIAVEGLRLLGR